jgi:HSP20 family protein
MTTQTKPETSPETKRYILPRVNIIDKEDTVVVEAELPGVPKEGVDLEVKDGELTLIGRRSNGEYAGRTLIAERPRADYRRVFALSSTIDASRIDAAMKNGLLLITLHKTDKAKPKRISIN